MSPANAPARGPEDYTLLVVDDLEDNRDLLCRRLAKRGFRVDQASTGEDALARIAEGDVDLVLLDINMPGLSGLDVLKAIRAKSSSAELPVIMATARAQSDSVVEALELGANDYVTKPIDFPVLNARVMATLSATEPKSRAQNPNDIGPGSVLLERYRLDRSIGRGGFGEVFSGTHLELQRAVAVKVLKVPSQDNDALARFRREGINACRVQHPNAVTVLDSGVSAEGIAFLVMELLEGQALHEEQKQWPTSAARAIGIVAPVCRALQVAHDMDIVHRDVKPANIFLHGEIPKVLDFGLAKIVGAYVVEQAITVDGWMVGTPLYMAPERFGSQSYDNKSDVYSIGIILHQMLTGSMPFDKTADDPIALAHTHAKMAPVPLRAVAPHLPEQLEVLILRALAKTPKERPSAAELADALETLAEECQFQAPEPQPTPSTSSLANISELPTLESESKPKTGLTTVNLTGHALDDDGLGD